MALAWNSPVLANDLCVSALRPPSAQVSAIQYSICLKQTHERSAMVSTQPVLWGLRITIEKNSRFDGRKAFHIVSRNTRGLLCFAAKMAFDVG